MITDIKSLIDFLYTWHNVEPADVCMDISDLPVMPPPLQDLYQAFGSLIYRDQQIFSGPFAKQDILVSPDQLKIEHGKLMFAYENQYVWQAYIDPGEEDPIVFLGDGSLDKPFDGYGGPAPQTRLSQFLISFCLQECMFGGKHSFYSDQVLAHDIYKVSLDALWVNGRYTTDEPTHNFYSNEQNNVLVAEFPEDWLPGTNVASNELVMADVLKPEAIEYGEVA